MTRKLTALSIVLVVILACGVSIAAASDSGTATVLKPSVPAVMIDGTTLAPFRAVTDWLGVSTAYDAGSQTVTASGRGHTVVLQIGSPIITIDEQKSEMAYPAVIYRGATLVPVRVFAEAFGVQVAYQKQPQLIILEIAGSKAIMSVAGPDAQAVAAVREALGLDIAARSVPMGGVYRVALHMEPKSNNVIAALGTEATVADFAVLLPQYSALYGNVAPRFDFAPGLAADDPGPFRKETVDGVEYYTATVPLRNDLVWSDGVKFTSADVEFTYNSILKVGPAKLSGNWEAKVNPNVIAKVEAIDEYTVKFWLKKAPGLSEWQYNALQVVILSKKHWEPVFNKALASADPVKALYEFKDVKPVTISGFVGGRQEPGAFYEIVKDPKSVGPYENTVLYKGGGMRVSNSKTGYKYGTGAGAVEMNLHGGPTIDSAIYRLYLNQNAAIAALQMGEVDYWLNSAGLTKGFREQLAKNPNITLIQNPQNGFRYLDFNMARAPFDDRAFRQAIATVIDRAWVADNILQGVVEPMASVVPPGNAYWHNADVKIWGDGLDEYDRVLEAVRILKAAGYSWDKEPKVVPARGGQAVEPGEGLKGPDGKYVRRLELLAPTAGYDPLRSSFALWIARWIRNLGIDVNDKLTDYNLMIDKQNVGEYDMMIMGWSLSLYPDHMYVFFHSDSSWNMGRYRNPAFDKLAEEFVSATDMEEARRLAFKCQEILAEDVPYVVLYVNPMIEAYRNDKVEYEFTKVLNGLQSVYGLPGGVHVRQ